MVGKKIDTLKKITAGQLLDLLIEKAVEARASFIHIEPRSAEVIVRYRVNGSLIEIDKFSKSKLESLSEKIKNLAGLENKLKNIPQDGRFKMSIKDEAFSMRVSILPTLDGERISINILSISSKLPSLVELGYWGTGLKAIQNALTQSHGVILIGGPANSGKSLSLVSMLNNITDTDIKIATIEDPVEYVLPKVNQTQVNHKTNLDFATGLKSIENQDTDVVMVSELRDSETANLVFNYGSNKNLILSSIYTKNINEAIEKLANIGISRPLIAHSLKLISSQRIVRRLCETCRELIVPNKYTLNLINDIFGLSSPKTMKYIHKLEANYKQESQKNQKGLNTTDTKIKKVYISHNEGCDDCMHTGYKGSVGLYEVVNVSESIQKLILSLASPKVLFDRAKLEGTTSVLVDGLVKSLTGTTSINEIFGIHQEYM